jgi:hypothetical protein
MVGVVGCASVEVRVVDDISVNGVAMGEERYATNITHKEP